MVKEESVLKNWLTDEIYSLLLVGKPGPTQSLRLCHSQTLAICYHSHSHWSIFTHCLHNSEWELHLLFTEPTFQEIISSEMSLMTSRSCILLGSVPVTFSLPIYVASTKLKSAVERIALFSGLGWLIRLNGIMLWCKAHYLGSSSGAVICAVTGQKPALCLFISKLLSQSMMLT